jgi:membrane peptidoglycan carboxypeptidase
MRSTSVALGRVLGLLSLFLVVCVVAGALVAGLLVPGVAAAGGATRGTINWFNDIEAQVPEYQLIKTSVLYAADGKTEIAKFHRENRTEVPLKNISKDMRNAVIAIEDSRFYDHAGVDPVGLMRAFVSNQFGDGGEQGASTLTQQYIKNLFVEKATAADDKQAYSRAVARDPRRKLLEIRAAIDTEKTMQTEGGKDEILRRYLNIAFFGNNAYGVHAAADRYFSTSAANLTLPQAAMLAGLVQSPTNYDPLSRNKARKDAALARRNTVLDRMHDLKLVSTKRWKAARASKPGLKPRTQPSGCIAADHGLSYFCQYIETLIANGAGPFKALGASTKQRLNTLYRGGLKIYSTIDLKTQVAAVRAVTRRVPIGDPSKVASAAVTVEAGTGRVLAMTQNKIFGNKSKDPARTSINYSVDTNLQGSSGFQTGSTFKPFTLAAYLKDPGNSLNDVVDGTKTKRPYNDFVSCNGERLGSGTYQFFNSERDEKKKSTVLEATRLSVNTAYVAMETKVPLCEIAKTAESMGVHLAAPAADCGGKPSIRIPTCIPSLTLGPLSIAPLTMAEAYATFAADGTHCPAWPIDKILDADRKPMPVKKPQCNEGALPEEVAHGVTHGLKKVLANGTAAGMWKGPGKAAGKTGTTDGSRDTWFVGYTRQRATAVWVGDTVETWQRQRGGKVQARKTLAGRKIGKRQYGSVYGATIAAPIWADIMKVAVRGTDTSDWDDPPARMFKKTGVQVPDVKGRQLLEAKTILEGAGFQVRIGRPVDSNLPVGTVAESTPSGGELTTPGDTVVIYPSTGRGGEPGAGRPGDRPVKPRRGPR